MPSLIARVMSGPRVISLLPSATEVLCSLPGGESLLVGRSHECDYPASLGPVPQHGASDENNGVNTACANAGVPILTSQRTTFTSASDIDEQVRSALSSGESLYSMNESKMKALKPDVILTQSLCNVCSIDVGEVSKLAASMGEKAPKVVSLNPHTLSEVLDSVLVVGEAVGLTQEASHVQESLRARVDAVVEKVKARAAGLATQRVPNVAFIEWSSPIYVGGHWTPELISMVGAVQSLNPHVGQKSFAIDHQKLIDADPERIIVCPCGLDLDKTEQMVEEFEASSWWWDLRAVRTGQVALVDGNQMFNRPGPRLVECLEWLYEWIDKPQSPGQSVYRPGPLSTFPWRQYRKFKAPGQEERMQREIVVDAEQLAIEEAHTAAVLAGKKIYIDPKTGYSVFTEQAGLDRGYCCGRGCRHCPYGHYNVDKEQRKLRKTAPIVKSRLLRHGGRVKKRLKGAAPASEEHVYVIFWSGGKDSYLSLLALREQLAKDKDVSSKIILLTTFDTDAQIVSEQEIEIGDIMEQAKALKEDLLLVPLAKASQNDAYMVAVRDALKMVSEVYGGPTGTRRSATLVFGDLHLADIRAWRENTFHDYECIFPIFGRPYEDLSAILFDKMANDEVQVVVSAFRTPSVEGSLLKLGAEFSPELFQELHKPGSAVDAFGENGEFHTHVRFSSSH